MRILLTNCSLESRGGSELYVLEAANWLRSQGHIIHSQHHLATMTALGRFPDTPTVYFCAS